MKKFFVFFAVVAVTIAFSSCATAPKEEIDAVNAAMEQAKAAHADVYLETEYLAIQDSLTAVNALIEAENAKTFGNYDVAKEKLANISGQVADLVAKTDAKKEEVKAEVAQMQAALSTVMAENQKLIEMAPNTKEGKAAVESIKANMAAINASLEELPALLEGDDLNAAKVKATSIQQEGTEINKELKSVVNKTKRK